MPFCTTPPAKVTVPSVVCELPPRFKTPPVVVMEPLVESRLSPPESTNEPSFTVVPPVYEFTPLKISAPAPSFTRLCVPARIALTVPLCATNAVPVEIKVPFCTTPPANVTVPNVVWLLPLSSNTPPLVVIEPLVESRLSPPESSNEPSFTVVPPVYEFTPFKVSAPAPSFTKACVPASTALTVPDCAANAAPVAVNVPF